MLKVRRSKVFTIFFRWYSRKALRDHFHKVWVLGAKKLNSINLNTPLIFFVNHAYWWDGFWTQLISEKYFKQNLFIIIEYRQLKRYSFFTKLGAFSIIRENPREAFETIQYAVQLLREPSHQQNALWIFPQGVISHVDQRPIHFFTGAAKIAELLLKQSSSIYLCSVATRIEYGDEQKPELFVSFHQPNLYTPQNWENARTHTHEMEIETERHLNQLKADIMSNQIKEAEILLEGALSVNRWFDNLKQYLGFSNEQTLQ